MDASDSNAGESCDISEVKVHNAAVEAGSRPAVDKLLTGGCAMTPIPGRRTWFHDRCASTV